MGPLSRLRTGAGRALGFGLLWIVLTGASGAVWGLGVATVLAATAASLALRPGPTLRWRAAGLARFVPYFLGQSLLGGLDVSRRAFHPRLPLSPAFLEWRCRLPAGPARVFFVNVLSLLPGTASAGLTGDVLRVHALDDRLPVRRSIAALEARVADVFGLPLGVEEGGPSPGPGEPAPPPGEQQ